MNASDTKSASKPNGTKTTEKPSVPSKAIKPAVQSALKRAALGIASALKPEFRSAGAASGKGSTRPPKKTDAHAHAEAGADSAAATRSGPVAMQGKPGSSKKPVTVAEKSTQDARQVTKAAPIKSSKAETSAMPNDTSHAVAANAKAPLSDAGKSTAVANAGLADRIETTVVSKVREVATKTSKSTPAVPDDGTLLTEAQIVKMSEKDYMNAAQLAFFRARLQQLEKDLLKNAGETTEHLRETVLVPDPADRATIEEEHALELRTRDRERKLLKKVQQSIASIDAGDYGWCEETGEPIGIPRLLARPTATLSLEAQQRRELKQKLYGD